MSKGKWQKGKITGDQEILSRDEALRILSEQAKRLGDRRCRARAGASDETTGGRKRGR